MTDLSGRTIGQYRLEAVIGRGSSATVYRAYQQSLGRQVAVKLLQPLLDPTAGARFRREAQAIAQLNHPNILPIYDFGEEDGRLYFVAQLIPGGANLDHQLSGRPMDVGPALALAGYLLDALGYAHGRGVTHRDVKPANILLPAPAWPLLADFGIAHIADETTQLTPPGTLLGTAAYLAPERALSRPADARSDLYSLGVVLYELLTGRLPFEGPTPAIVVRAHVHDRPPSPRGLNPALTPALERALLRALEKDPARRYQSAAEMAAALDAAARQSHNGVQPPAAPPPDPYRTAVLSDPDTLPPTPAPAPQPPLPVRRRRPGAILPLALAALLALGAALWFARGTPAADPRAPGPSQQRGSPVASSAGGPPVAASTAPTAAPPTEAPAPAPTAAPPTEAPAPAPTAPPVAPTAAPPAPAAAATATPEAPLVPAPAAGSVILDDDVWAGGYGGVARRRSYGGRSAVWIYGQGAGYDTMRARFALQRQPRGVATLTVEGMDAEGRGKAAIAVSVNGVVIFEGPNPLPDDDQPVESGTWAAASWTFDAALLRPGANEIRIANRSPGRFSLPPFLMLDYASVTLSE
jgi:serine/threonine-protein kinase